MTTIEKYRFCRRRRGLALGFAVLAGLWGASSVCAQDSQELWLSAKVKVRSSDTLAFGVQQDIRYDQEMSRLKKVMPTVSADVAATDAITLSLGYRLMFVRDSEDVFERAHRLQGDLNIKPRTDLVRFTYRMRIQDVMQRGDNELLEHDFALRNRVGIAVHADSGLRPYLSTENYFRFAGDKQTEITRQRFTGGIKYQLDEHTLDISYRWDVSLGSGNGVARIMRFGYALSL